MIDATTGMLITKGLAGMATVSLLTAGVYLVPTKRAQGVLMLMATIILAAPFVMLLPNLSRTEMEILDLLTTTGTVLAAINLLATRFQYRGTSDRNSHIIRNFSVIGTLSSFAANQGVLGMAAGWNSEWQVAVMMVMGTAAIVATMATIACLPARNTA